MRGDGEGGVQVASACLGIEAGWRWYGAGDQGFGIEWNAQVRASGWPVPAPGFSRARAKLVMQGHADQLLRQGRSGRSLAPRS